MRNPTTTHKRLCFEGPLKYCIGKWVTTPDLVDSSKSIFAFVPVVADSLTAKQIKPTLAGLPPGDYCVLRFNETPVSVAHRTEIEVTRKG